MVKQTYDPSFKEAAVQLVISQGRNHREVANELGVHPDTLRNWLKHTGHNTASLNKSNKETQRIRQLEQELKALRKQTQEKDEVIRILKKSIGILGTP